MARYRNKYTDTVEEQPFAPETMDKIFNLNMVINTYNKQGFVSIEKAHKDTRTS